MSLDGDADRDQRDDLVAVGIADRDHGAHRRPERAGVLLGEDLALGRVAEVADERLADLVGVRVRVAGAVQAHDHDEVDVGVDARPARRTAAASRVGSGDTHGRPHGGGVGHRLGDRDRAVASRARGRRGGRRTPPARSPTDNEDDDHAYLEQQDLPGDRELGQGPRAIVRVIVAQR